jgi:hypothetical protein
VVLGRIAGTAPHRVIDRAVVARGTQSPVGDHVVRLPPIMASTYHQIGGGDHEGYRRGDVRALGDQGPGQSDRGVRARGGGGARPGGDREGDGPVIAEQPVMVAAALAVAGDDLGAPTLVQHRVNPSGG